MRKKYNGFTKFMSKLDGKPKVKPKYLLGDVTVNSREALKSVCDGNISALMDAFLWRSTSQGHGYWDSRYEGEELMTDEDWEFCDALLELHS